VRLWFLHFGLLKLLEAVLEANLDCGDVTGSFFEEGVKFMLDLAVDGPIIFT